MTALDIIKGALEDLGVVAVEEPLSNADAQTGLSALNSMINHWSVRRLMVYALIKESFTLTIGTNSYTIGAGGVFNTARPNKIAGAFVRNSNGNDYPLDVLMTQDAYNSIGTKTTQGLPDSLYYDPQYPLGVIYLSYAPDQAYTLFLESLKSYADIGAITASVDATFPPEYREALRSNLAIRLAPKYGVLVPQTVMMIAGESLDALRAQNFELNVAQMEFGKAKRRYNIYEG